MPQDRLRHQRAGHSMKLTALTDFEYRVWDQYQLSADDFGIMRCSPLVIQAGNDALATRPAKLIQRALDRLIAVFLVKAFEHQRTRYIFDPVWQYFQKIEYPKQTINPAPTPDALADCHPLTQELFRQCFGKPSVKFRLKDAEFSTKDCRESDAIAPAPAREEAKARANGLGKRLTPNGHVAAAPATSEPERVVEAFRGRWKSAYGVECSLILKPLEFMQLEQQLSAHGEARLLTAIAAYFATEDAYVRKARHPLALFLRDPLKHLAGDAVVSAGRPKGCHHTPPCADSGAHTRRYIAEQNTL